MIKTRRGRATALLVSGSLAALGYAGCGGKDFENEPRPPIAVALTGVITESQVTISPDQLGAGPIVLTISNQTDESHTVTLDGEGVRERVGPINPSDTGTIQKDLAPGTYQVRAGSERAVEQEIEPGTIIIGPKRETAEDETLLP